MSKIKLRTLISTLILFLFANSSCSFFWENPLSGTIGASSSISISKDRNVFIMELFSDSVIWINDSINLDIDHCWIEHTWYFGENAEESVKMDSFSLLIQLKTLNQNFHQKYRLVSMDLLDQIQFSIVGDSTLHFSHVNEYKNLNFSLVNGIKPVHNVLELDKRILGSFSLEKYLPKIKQVYDSIYQKD